MRKTLIITALYLALLVPSTVLGYGRFAPTPQQRQDRYDDNRRLLDDQMRQQRQELENQEHEMRRMERERRDQELDRQLDELRRQNDLYAPRRR